MEQQEVHWICLRKSLLFEAKKSGACSDADAVHFCLEYLFGYILYHLGFVDFLVDIRKELMILRI